MTRWLSLWTAICTAAGVHASDREYINSVVHPFFFFNDPATTEIYTLSLHDALPISGPARYRSPRRRRLADPGCLRDTSRDRKSTRLNSSHLGISYAVFCLKKKKKTSDRRRTRQPRIPSRRQRVRHRIYHPQPPCLQH